MKVTKNDKEDDKEWIKLLEKHADTISKDESRPGIAVSTNRLVLFPDAMFKDEAYGIKFLNSKQQLTQVPEKEKRLDLLVEVYELEYRKEIVYGDLPVFTTTTAYIMSETSVISFMEWHIVLRYEDRLRIYFFPRTKFRKRNE